MSSVPIANLKNLLARVLGKGLVTTFFDSFFSSDAEAVAGTVTNKAVTPANLTAALTGAVTGPLTADVNGRARLADSFFNEATATAKFVAGAITTALLKAGIISADATGRALFAAGVIDEATATSAIAAGAIPGSKIKSGDITNTQIAAAAAIAGSKLLALDEPGQPSYGTLRIAANVADGETVTIGTEVYEFDTEAAPGNVTPGNIRVDVNAGVIPATASAALVAAINGNGTGAYYAVAPDANTVLVVTRVASVATPASTETMGGAGNAWDAVTLNAGRAAGRRRVHIGRRVPLAAEVTAGFMVVPVPFDPNVALFHARVTASGAIKSLDGAVTLVAAVGNAPAYVKVDNSGGTDWAATDTVLFTIFE